MITESQCVGAACREVEASMRPRSDDHGKKSHHKIPEFRAACFNEAAIR